MDILKIINLIEKRAFLAKQIKIANMGFYILRTKEALDRCDTARKEYYDIYREIYTFEMITELLTLCNTKNEKIVISDRYDSILYGYLNNEGVITLTLNEGKKKSKLVYDSRPEPVDLKPDTRSDDEIVYEFILHNQANGIDCTKKFVESMLTAKISRARIGDTLTRLVMVGLNGKKLTMTDSNDLTINDKVYKII